jgi:tRNA-splicing ligase RtcB
VAHVQLSEPSSDASLAKQKYELKKIGDVEYRVDKSARKGMRVPVTIYANDSLIAKMQTDRTIGQAVNVSFLPGVKKHVIVLPDGHEGYGFPIGGVAATDYENGVISPGGVGYDINCLPAGTQVLTPLGYTMSIDSLKIGDEVVCFNDGIAGDTHVSLTMARGTEELFQVRTRSGILIRATGDHPILTSLGMVEARNVTKGTKVATYPFLGVKYSEPRNFTILETSSFSSNVAKELIARGLLPLNIRDKKFPYLVKLLAYFMGGGAFDGKKTWFYGTHEGIEEVRRDIQCLGFIPSKTLCRYRLGKINGKTCDSIECCVYVSAWSFRKLLESLGAPSGRKTKIELVVPPWLFETPTWIKRLFLAGYCGARMTKPQTINGFDFEPPVVSISKFKEVKTSVHKFLGGLWQLFEEFGVEVFGISEEKIDQNVNLKLKLQLSTKSKSLLALWSTIGYLYAPHKQRLALAAVAWLGWKSLVIEGIEKTAITVAQLHMTGYSMSIIENRVISPSVNRRLVERNAYGGRTSSPSVPFPLPKFEEWKEAALDGDIVWDEVAQVERSADFELVYDITVRDEAHNFVAQGFVVSNCGVRLIRTNLTEKDVRPKLRELSKELFRAVPSGLGSSGALNLTNAELDRVLSEGVRWAVSNGYGTSRDLEFCEENGNMKHSDPSKVSGEAKKRGSKSLGTLGSGNHFIEVEVVNQIIDPEASKTFGIHSVGQVCVLMHTGSRGLGHQVCSDYLRIVEANSAAFKIDLPDRELACAPAGSREAENYRLAMGAALNYAWTNRQVITQNVRRAFERVFRLTASDLEMNLVYDVAHNICKVEEHRVDFDNPKKVGKVFVHRKGATRAFPRGSDAVTMAYRNVGQPVLIPGSMGTASWILLGQEKSLEVSFGSTAHGAGRMMSRGAAIRAYPYDVIRRDLEGRGIILEAASKKGAVEEAPGAYKDVDAVAEVSHKVGIATKVARLTPMAVIKG